MDFSLLLLLLPPFLLHRFACLANALKKIALKKEQRPDMHFFFLTPESFFQSTEKIF